MLLGSEGAPSVAFAEREGVSPSYFTWLVRLSYLAAASPKRTSTGAGRAI
jgi:hypothetical protein